MFGDHQIQSALNSLRLRLGLQDRLCTLEFRGIQLKMFAGTITRSSHSVALSLCQDTIRSLLPVN